jgi:hypothetical protein
MIKPSERVIEHAWQLDYATEAARDGGMMHAGNARW